MAKKTIEKTEQFIELRAKGMSFSKISDELDVSKPILIQWARDMRVEILNKRAFEIEALHDKYLLTKEKELERLSALLENVESAIDKSDLSKLTAKELFEIRDKLITRMSAERTEFKFTEKVTVSGFELPNDFESHEEIRSFPVV
jgi:hypothetical protein